MLPSVVAREIREAVLDYLRTTYRLGDSGYEKALFDFLGDPERGMFKGPFFEVSLPFESRHIKAGEQPEFLELAPPFSTPYHHQYEAWESLSSKNKQPEHTLITTGTGSGKSESFLVPILDHCYRHRNTPGVKALILYPMNALASDQARRLAELIYENKHLRHNDITAALYTGDRDDSRTKVGRDHLIEAQSTIRENPPDILLTNYKMLDYLLLRDSDRSIWQKTAKNALRYVAIDELHTFDGAQGTDVAMLLRRFRALDAVHPDVTAIGTSATLASGDAQSAERKLQRFAREVFGIRSEESIRIVQERRPQASVYIDSLKTRIQALNPTSRRVARPVFQDRDDDPKNGAKPPIASILLGADGVSDAELHKRLNPVATPAGNDFFRDIHRLILDCDPVDTGNNEDVPLRTNTAALVNHPLFEPLVRQCAAISMPSVITQMLRKHQVWLDQYDERSAKSLANEWASIDERGLSTAVLECFVALMSFAELAEPTALQPGEDDAAGVGTAVTTARPFVGERIVWTRTHLWVRELRGMARRIRGPAHVDSNYTFHWNEDQSNPDYIDARPVHCRSCGAHGVAAYTDDTTGPTSADGELHFAFQAVGQRWHRQNTGARFVGLEDVPETSRRGARQMLNLHTKSWHYAKVEEADANDESHVFPIVTTSFDSEGSNPKFAARCAWCREDNALIFTSGRAAMLNSVMITAEFQSLWSGEPRLLSFVDSVQDATHRAGYFSTRAYGFLLRSAFQTAVDSVGAGELLTLDELGNATIKALEASGRQTPRELVANLLPPDLEGWEEYQEFLDDHHAPPLSQTKGTKWESFGNRLRERIQLEALLEFGQFDDRGRTLIESACAVVSPDSREVEAVSERLAAVFREEPPRGGTVRLSFEDEQTHLLTNPQTLQAFVYGIVERLRQRGGIHNSFYTSYATELGNSYLLSKHHQFHIRPGLVRRSPEFVSHGHSKTELTTFIGKQTSVTWLQDFTQRFFRLGAAAPALIEDILYRTFAVLSEQASTFETEPLLVELKGSQSKKHATVWGVNPRALLVRAADTVLDADDGYELACSEHNCSSRVFAARDEMAARVDAPCPNMRCAGRLKKTTVRARDYYARLYRQPRFERVIAKEHTGILDKESRQYIERNFSKSSAEAPGRPNVIVATPTLEMGIDIGALDVVMLSSTPRTVANMRQRFGRGGRREKQALVLHTTQLKTWDLHVYDDPLAQLRGDVEPPHLYLNAQEMLRRQFFAYAIGSWIRADDKHRLPRNFTTLRRAWKELMQSDEAERKQAETRQTKEFIPGFFAYFDHHAARFYDEFTTALAISDRPRPSLYKNDESSPTDLTQAIRRQLYARLAEEDNQLRELKNAMSRIDNRVTQRRKEIPTSDQEKDETIRELQSEQNNVKRLYASLQNRQTLDALHRHALLPNYAFPEDAVEFYSRVWSSRRQLGGADSDNKVVEAQRSPSGALRELAPGSRFFYDGYSHGIEGIETNGGKAIESFYLCQRCDWHARRADIETIPHACKRCAGALREVSFVQLTGSRASANRFDDRVGDAQDERNVCTYETRWLANYANVRERRYRDGEQGPGFGYAAQAALLEVNFGEPNSLATGLTVSGEQIQARPFIICPSCGQAQLSKSKGIKHLYRCQRKGEDAQIDVRLYRQLQSETIRLHLPPGIGQTDASFTSLKAAIRCGMAERWGGDVSHIELIETFASGSEQLRERGPKVLIMLDTIPGGTGLLKDLFEQPANDYNESGDAASGELGDSRAAGEDRLRSERKPFSGLGDILDSAAQVLISCDCSEAAARSVVDINIQDVDSGDGDGRQGVEQAEAPDGCFQCIRRYAAPFEMHAVRKSLALEQLNRLRIALRSDELDEIPEGELDGFGMSRAESELEVLFFAELKEAIEKIGGKVSRRPDEGVDVYELVVPGVSDDNAPGGRDDNVTDSEHNGTLRWLLHPQQNVRGSLDGVTYLTRPDYLIERLPAEAKPSDGEHKDSADENAEQKPQAEADSQTNQKGSESAQKIAIYTDGHSFHVCPNQEESRLEDDFLKRAAILGRAAETGESHLVFSLGWKDLEEFQANGRGQVVSDDSVTKQLFSGDARHSVTTWNPMSLLVEVLRQPERSLWTRLIREELSIRIQHTNPTSSDRALEDPDTLAVVGATTEWESARQLSADDAVGVDLQAHRRSPHDAYAFQFMLTQSNPLDPFGRDTMRARLATSKAARDSESFERRWRAFLQATNWMQFLEDAQIAVGEDAPFAPYSAVPPPGPRSDASAGPQSPIAAEAKTGAARTPNAWPTFVVYEEAMVSMLSAAQFTLLTVARTQGVTEPSFFTHEPLSNADHMVPLVWTQAGIAFTSVETKQITIDAYESAGFVVVTPRSAERMDHDEFVEMMQRGVDKRREKEGGMGHRNVAEGASAGGDDL